MKYKVYSILLFIIVGASTMKSQDVYEQCSRELCNCLGSIDFTKTDQIYKEYEECTNRAILKFENQFENIEGVDFKSSGSVEKMIAKLTNNVISSCPNEYTKILEVIGNTTKLQTVEGRIISIEQKGLFKMNIRNDKNESINLVVINYFPEAKQRLEYLLANKDKRYKFEYKKVSILDLELGTFKDYLEITKIIIL